jgi:hypothetical protein
VYSLAVSGTNLWAATDDGVFSTANSGNNWGAVNTGLTTPRIFSLTVAGTNLLAGSQGGGVWRRPLNEVILDVEENGNRPIVHKLEQNYPNPFNPTTRIQFSIPVGTYGNTSLRVYDVLGKEVATLLNEQLQAGSYSATFDANGLSSGVYFYNLHTGNVSETKKMILAR